MGVLGQDGGEEARALAVDGEERLQQLAEVAVVIVVGVRVVARRGGGGREVAAGVLFCWGSVVVVLG